MNGVDGYLRYPDNMVKSIVLIVVWIFGKFVNKYCIDLDLKSFVPLCNLCCSV